MSWLQKLKTAMFGADATDVADPTITEDEARAAFSALMGGKGVESRVEKTGEMPPPPVAFADSPEARAMQKRIDDLEVRTAASDAKAEEERKLRVAAEAAAFADAVIEADRAVPAQRPDLVADYTEAAELDRTLSGQVAFADDKGHAVQGTRVDRLKARARRLPALGLHGERMARAEAVGFALDNGKVPDPDAPPDRAWIDRQLSHTATGRAILAERNGAKAR